MKLIMSTYVHVLYMQHLPADCAQCVPLAVFAKLTWPTRTIHKTPDREVFILVIAVLRGVCL